jgi:hypothetical protein
MYLKRNEEEEEGEEGEEEGTKPSNRGLVKLREGFM